MQRVIELGRTVRERALKPLKTPLPRLVVVHADAEFLADIEGALLLRGGRGRGGVGLFLCVWRGARRLDSEYGCRGVVCTAYH
jgi:hypothetical protein